MMNEKFYNVLYHDLLNTYLIYLINYILIYVMILFDFQVKKDIIGIYLVAIKSQKKKNNPNMLYYGYI
jgi:hypothetical protein